VGEQWIVASRRESEDGKNRDGEVNNIRIKKKRKKQ
jgi:hypothetical protein